MAKGDRVHITLRCRECQSFSYHSKKNRRNTTERLELRKYCPPCRAHQYTVIRSPFVHKDGREQFEMRTHKRLIDILEPTGRTVDTLMRLQLPSGVDIEIKL